MLYPRHGSRPRLTEQVGNDVSGAEVQARAGDEVGQEAEVLTQGQQRRFGGAVVKVLGQADRGRQSRCTSTALGGVLDGRRPCGRRSIGFGGAAVPDSAVGPR